MRNYKIHKKIMFILLIALMSFQAQILALPVKDNEVPLNLEESSKLSSEEEPPLENELSGIPDFTINAGDTLSITVWQNLSVKKPGEEKPLQIEYAIHKGDTLEISVWQWPDLTKDAVVGPDGKISFPLIGDIEVEGLTSIELDNLLTEKLTEFIKSPEVSVMIKGFGLAGGAYQAAIGFIKIDDLSLEDIKVRPDGKISFPLVGDVQVEGLTLEELRLSLSQRLSNFVANPDVFIQITEFAGNKVFVLGEVSDPGVYDAENITVLEALSLAGGYTKDAILRNVFVIRGSLTNPQVFNLNLSKAITGKDISQNIKIQPRDIVYIPKSFIADVNYVLTQLLSPLTSSSSAITAIKAIRIGPSPKKK